LSLSVSDTGMVPVDSLAGRGSLGCGVMRDGARAHWQWIHPVPVSGSLVGSGGKVLVGGGEIRCEMRWMDCKVDRQHHELERFR
jgi:hypothetical protein